jgi:hypothetical protein
MQVEPKSRLRKLRPFRDSGLSIHPVDAVSATYLPRWGKIFRLP